MERWGTGAAFNIGFPTPRAPSWMERNGAGRFRVLLHVEDKAGNQDWAAQGVVAVSQWHDAANTAVPTLPGLAWKIYPGTWTELPDLDQSSLLSSTATAPNLQADAQGFTRYAAAWDGFIDIPADGGYTFHLIDARRRAAGD